SPVTHAYWDRTYRKPVDQTHRQTGRPDASSNRSTGRIVKLVDRTSRKLVDRTSRKLVDRTYRKPVDQTYRKPVDRTHPRKRINLMRPRRRQRPHVAVGAGGGERGRSPPLRLTRWVRPRRTKAPWAGAGGG